MDPFGRGRNAYSKAAPSGHRGRGWTRTWRVLEQSSSAGTERLQLCPDIWVSWPGALDKIEAEIRTRTSSRVQPNFTCTCGKSYPRQECTAAALCWLSHAKVAVQKAIANASPRWSRKAGVGRVLRPGKVCSNRGSNRGGWVCGGDGCHTASCYHVRIYEKQRDRQKVNASSQTVGHCVHHNRHADAWRSDGQLLRRVLNHLRAHRKSENALRRRMVCAFRLTTKRSRRARIMLPAPQVSNAPPDLQARISAFAEAPQHLPVAQLTHRLAAPAGYPVTGMSTDCSATKPGASYLVGDGVAQCILRVDAERGTAFVAELHRNDVCTRGLHQGPCWSYARQGNAVWARLADLGDSRVCFSPRFAARSHLTRKLDRLCFKQVQVGNGESAWTRQTRLHKVFEGAGVTLKRSEARMLADLFPEKLCWFRDESGLVLDPSAVRCPKCMCGMRWSGTKRQRTTGLGMSSVFRSFCPCSGALPLPVAT